jgi:cyclophilin family peptidyl-prolyl cis-trans isomerase
VRIVYRHFPLTSIHEKAMLAAEAAEAAGAQGAFWEMHDLLFAQQSAWADQSVEAFRTTLEGFARDLDLDGDAFTEALDSGTYRGVVEDALDEAIELGLPGTPMLFINGQYYDGPRSAYVLDAIAVWLNYDGVQYDAPGEMNLDPEGTYIATVETTQGSFCIELYPARAPKLVNSFVFLASEGFFDDTPFHRVIPGFVVQGGDPTGTGLGGPGYRIEDEIDPDLLHDGPGVVSMANAGANTNGSQFFITLDALPDLDGGYSIIGRVVEGMEVVERMTPRDLQQGISATPDRIERMTIGSTCDAS